MTARIEAQAERFAPGFRDHILARATSGPVELEAYNPNHIGGDINGGIQDLRPARHQPGRPPRSMFHPGPRHLLLLVVDAARGSGSRHVRRHRGPLGAAPGVRTPYL